MKTDSGFWTPKNGLNVDSEHITDASKENLLVLFFADRKQIEAGDFFEDLRQRYPNGHLVGCSSGGEILQDYVSDEGCVFSCIDFEHTTYKIHVEPLLDHSQSFTAGHNVGNALDSTDLKAVFVLSDGLHANGSRFVQGINESTHDGVVISGGLAADNMRFESTCVGYNENPKPKQVVAIGFYGEKIDIRTGSKDGWSIFGPIRTITKASGPVLFELDGKPALDVYKKYLGDEAKDLPKSGLSFPCAIWSPEQDFSSYVIRTILAVDEEEQSMTFAGDIPQGHHLRLMWGKFDELIDAAARSAQTATPFSSESSDSLSIMISCIGRKALMGQRIIQEIIEAHKIFDNKTTNIGFYSYGEIAKHQIDGKPVLHNQTMTITTFSEIA